ncbi:hypothetical protein A2U01_0011309, partial [Trifolium medium]|nr:hypothetical protein [Trifolium medium]
CIPDLISQLPLFQARWEAAMAAMTAQQVQAQQRSLSSKGYRPDTSNLPRNIDLNQGLPEYQPYDPMLNINVEDYAFIFDEDEPVFFCKLMILCHVTGNQSGRDTQQVSLPELSINEGGRGRAGRTVPTNISRGKGNNDRGKRPTLQPENDHDE